MFTFGRDAASHDPSDDTHSAAVMQWGVNAVTCFLNAARSLSELQSRKLLARIFSLFSMDDSSAGIRSAFEKLAPALEPQ